MIGGTVSATFIRCSLNEVVMANGIAFKALLPSKELCDLNGLVDLTEELIGVSRKNGTMALEKIEVNNEYYATAVRMVVDGYAKELVLDFLREQNHLFNERTATASGIFRAVGDAAPAFGMIGTLVGLVQMLVKLSDPAAIGPAMAVAMLTTLYGALIANLIALPLADKIDTWAAKESVRQHLIIDAVHSLTEGHNPAIMRQLLSAYLKGTKKKSEDAATPS